MHDGRTLMQMAADVALGLALNGAFGVLAWRARSTDLSGMLAGIVLGTVVFATSTWRGFIVMAVFVASGFAVTRMGRDAKLRRGIAQSGGGPRSAAHAVANLATGAGCAVMLAVTGERLWAWALTGAFCAAAADTAGTEIGQWLGGQPRRLPALRPAPPGTPGAVSPAGLAGGLLTAAVVAAASIGWVGIDLRAAAALAACGAAASLLESAAGGHPRLTTATARHALNLANTVAGALLAATCQRWWWT